MTGEPSRPWSLAEIIADLDPDGKIRAGYRAGDAKTVSPASSPTSVVPDFDDLPPLQKRIDRARKYLARKPGGVQGAHGSKPTFDAARDLVRGFLLDEQTALGLMLSEFNPKCDPPWSVADLTHKLRDAATKPHGKPPGYLLTKRPDQVGSATAPAPPPAAPPGPPDQPPAVPPAGSATAQAPTVQPDDDLNEADDDPHKLTRAVLAGFLAGGRRTLTYWQGEFHVWDGCRYLTEGDIDFRPRVNRIVRRELVAIYKLRVKAWEASGREGEPPRVTKTTDSLIGNVLAAMRGEVQVQGVTEAPAWFAGVAGPDPRELVVTRNGIIHLPAYAAREPGAVRPNTPEYLTFNALEFAVAPDAPPPATWIAFLETLWPGDRESVALLQEWFGYLLTPDNRMQKMFLMVGPPRSGKGTIARVLQELVGPSNVANPTLGSLGGEFGLESMVGKSMAVIEDARLSKRTDTAVVTERLLTISGGGRIDVNRKHKAHFTGRLTARFVVATNEIPDLSDASGALANRWCLLRFTRSFLGKEDDTLVDKLLAELPGIFNWAVAGWRRLRSQRRFTAPSASNDMVEDMHNSGSPVGEFVREVCVTGPSCVVSVADLYGEWRRWCESTGRKEPGTHSTFGRQLRAYLHTVQKCKPRRDGRQVQSYQGIALRPFDDDSGSIDDRLPFEPTTQAVIHFDPVGETGTDLDATTLPNQGVTSSGPVDPGKYPLNAYGGSSSHVEPEEHASRQSSGSSCLSGSVEPRSSVGEGEL